MRLLGRNLAAIAQRVASGDNQMTLLVMYSNMCVHHQNCEGPMCDTFMICIGFEIFFNLASSNSSTHTRGATIYLVKPPR